MSNKDRKLRGEDKQKAQRELDRARAAAPAEKRLDLDELQAAAIELANQNGITLVRQAEQLEAQARQLRQQAQDVLIGMIRKALGQAGHQALEFGGSVRLEPEQRVAGTPPATVVWTDAPPPPKKGAKATSQTATPTPKILPKVADDASDPEDEPAPPAAPSSAPATS
jgi:hypothetical protein